MRRVVIGLYLLVGACTFDPLAGAQLTGPSIVQDAGMTEDAAISIDGGAVADAGIFFDSGAVVDGGAPDAAADAGVPDATPDAGQPMDAGPPDIGVVLDTGMPDTGLGIDAGMPDTGVLLDTGVVPDAGMPDTGVGVDAGPPAICGNEQIEVPEACDDGNMIGTDGCAGCQVTLGWRCLFQPSRCVQLINVIQVDGTAANCNSGSLPNANPWCDLGDALDQTPVPELILVANDVYEEDLLIDSPITVIVYAENGATILSDNGKAVIVKSGANVTISGFTIQGDGMGGNGGVKGENAGTMLTLLNNYIGPSDARGLELKSDARLYMSGNVVADNEAGGLYLDSNTGYTVWNNIIKNNGNSGSDFGGVRIKKTSNDSRFINNTVAFNSATSMMMGEPAGLRCDVDQELINVIVWANMGAGPSGLSSRCQPRYSLLQSNVSGLGNLSASPLLVGPLLTLDMGSPARNAGNPLGVIPLGPAPLRDFSGNRRPLLLNVDMGAHESP